MRPGPTDDFGRLAAEAVEAAHRLYEWLDRRFGSGLVAFDDEVLSMLGTEVGVVLELFESNLDEYDALVLWESLDNTHRALEEYWQGWPARELGWPFLYAAMAALNSAFPELGLVSWRGLRGHKDVGDVEEWFEERRRSYAWSFSPDAEFDLGPRPPSLAHAEDLCR